MGDGPGLGNGEDAVPRQQPSESELCGRGIALGYLPAKESRPGSNVEIEYFGDRLSATVRPTTLFDPHNVRLRS
ncbi:MAG: hypothetical protein IH998_13745 [Proteobacteria bacterium]|nr:hypothetical protein [Pseudomonadota bacterium]